MTFNRIWSLSECHPGYLGRVRSLQRCLDKSGKIMEASPMSTWREFNRPLHERVGLRVWKSAWIVTRVALIAGSLVIASSSPTLADTHECSDLRLSLSDQFPNRDCFRELHRGGGYDGTSWVETIKSSNAEFDLFILAQRAANSRTYLDSMDIIELFEDYDFGADVRMIGEPRSAMDGVEFVTIQGASTCILFLKQAMPRRRGYALTAWGIGCDPDKVGIYREEDANRLISEIDFPTR